MRKCPFEAEFEKPRSTPWPWPAEPKSAAIRIHPEGCMARRRRQRDGWQSGGARYSKPRRADATGAPQRRQQEPEPQPEPQPQL
jgi:hypothetical protein